MGSEDEKRELAEALDAPGPIVHAVSEMARKAGVTVIAGGIPERSADSARPYNTCIVVDRGGSIVARYRKMHLFDVDLTDGTRLLESSATTAGEAAVVADVDGFKVGLSICYDLRFPELYRVLVEHGAELLVVPSAFTLHTGRDHWHVLLRARAIEAQSFVLAAAQWGKHANGRVTYGHSLVVDPWGIVLAEAPDRVSVVVAELERSDLDRVRASLPSLRHRRL